MGLGLEFWGFGLWGGGSCLRAVGGLLQGLKQHLVYQVNASWGSKE